MLSYSHTPVEEISHPLCDAGGIRLLVKREDLNHPAVSGNKWWKLKHNLAAASSTAHRTILTFGGAYSNHIYATAAAARIAGMRSIGVIRGEETLPMNPTLRFASDQGMKLHYVDRSAYRMKDTDEFLHDLRQRFGDAFVIPEGGSNLLAVKGCAEFAESELTGIAFDHLMLPVGTGGTMAGLICGLRGDRNILGVSVLKGGDFLTSQVANLVRSCCGSALGNWRILTNHHEGGYAKVSGELLSFMNDWYRKYHVPLDHVYTGKLLLAVTREILAGTFRRGSTVLVLHTGGLQGAQPLNTKA